MSSPILVALLLANFRTGRLITGQKLSTSTGKVDWRDVKIPTCGSGEEFAKGYDIPFSDYLREVGAPGGSLAIYYKGKKVYSKGFGYADFDQKIAFTASTPSRISSLSKYLTQRAVKILIEEGDLEMNTRAVDVLARGGIVARPPKGKIGDPRVAKITIQQLLEHKSGLVQGLDISECTDNQVLSEMGFETPVSGNDALGYILGQPLQDEPGETYSYSNYGYALLGKIIQIVSGIPYEDFVKVNVLKPQTGTMSWFTTSAQRKDKRQEEAEYYADRSTPTWNAFRWDILPGAGGWVAPTDGIAEFFAKEFPGPGWDYTLFGSYTGAVTVMKVHKNSLVFAASVNYRRGESANDNDVLFKRLEQVSDNLKLPQ
jgi:CubicO group peptidase (beta-lactamase class C family)